MLTGKMTPPDFVAVAEATIKASVPEVWNALVNPDIIKKYMFGATVISDWKEGSTITWKGTTNYAVYEDHGVILKIVPYKLLQYTHFSPLSGLADIAENYHTITIELTENGKETFLSLTQDHNKNKLEREHSQKNWQTMLLSLKKLLEEKEEGK